MLFANCKICNSEYISSSGCFTHFNNQSDAVLGPRAKDFVEPSNSPVLDDTIPDFSLHSSKIEGLYLN